MYYSATTLDNKEALHTGRNSESLEECVQDVWDFLTTDGDYSEEDEERMLKFTIADKHRHLMTSFDIIFIEHTELYEDSDEN
jgi:replicative DNA helicase